MKLRKEIVTLSMCAIFMGSFAQKSKDRITIPLESVNVIVIKGLTGTSTLLNSHTNELKMKSELFTQGIIWGWSFPKVRPAFSIKSRQSNDTLYMEMPMVYSFSTVGISTYEERIINFLQIPPDKQVLIEEADTLIVEDEFSFLQIQNTKNLSFDSISKAKMSSIMCNATQSLTINGIKSAKRFEFQGSGLGHYTLEANTITLNIK